MNRIIVDADSCPVKDIIIEIGKKYNFFVIFYSDTSHLLKESQYAKVVTVDKGSDSADLAIINVAEKNDIIVTQDYGVASMGLGKSCYCINNNGFIYTNDNIDRLMMERHISAKARRAGKKTANPSKRKNEDDILFKNNLIKLCKIAKK